MAHAGADDRRAPPARGGESGRRGGSGSRVRERERVHRRVPADVRGDARGPTSPPPADPSDFRQPGGSGRATLVGVFEDFERCYRAVQSRDTRFDGWFFGASRAPASTAGRAARPARPKREHMRFFATAAAAQLAGFRACKRCRPDASPGSPEWNQRADLVGRAMRLIADGVVDREGVAGLARQLHYSERHLHRQLVAEVGAGPIALARAQRGPDRADPHRDDGRPHLADRVRERLREHPPVQRHDPRRVRGDADRSCATAPGLRPRADPNGCCGRGDLDGRHDHAATAVPRAARHRSAARLPRGPRGHRASRQ